MRGGRAPARYHGPMSQSPFDDLEVRPPGEREAALFDGLGARLAAAAADCPGLARHLDGAELDAVDSREALAGLPLLTKADLVDAQRARPPLGGFVRESALRGPRLFVSPGPVWEPQPSGVDPWWGARALHAAGFRPRDVVHNAFGYHRTPGGWILDEAACALGCTVFPAGTGDTAGQVEALRHTRAVGYTGTPDYLGALLDHAGGDGGAPLDHLTRALVSGGALFPALRQRYADAGVRCLQCYATADLGVIAYESATDGTVHPGMLVNEGLIVEICRPGTGEPAPAGEVGEVVVTRLDTDYPLVRFATGDLSRMLDGPSPCGRTAPRIAGWLGRADQRTKVRGLFVDPRQVQAIRADEPRVDALRLVVEREADRDVMTLEVAGKALDDDALAGLEAALKRRAGLAGAVRRVDEVPNDGTVIRDLRDYDRA